MEILFWKKKVSFEDNTFLEPSSTVNDEYLFCVEKLATLKYYLIIII